MVEVSQLKSKEEGRAIGRMNNRLRVLIVSQQSLFQQGMVLLLSQMEGMEVSTTSAGKEETMATIDAILPDVAIVDIDAPTENGIALAQRIKQRSPNIAVVTLSSMPNDAQLFQVLKAQAAAYLSKEVTPDQLADVIKNVAHGEHPINESVINRPKVAEQVLQQFQELSWQSEAEALVSPLTPRETEILNYIGQGHLNKQIALKLGISEQTIKNHVTSILRKLNANARTEAVVVAIKQGLISIK